MISSTMLGYLLSDNSKKKVKICEELILLCDLLSAEIAFLKTPAVELLESALSSGEMSSLGFISPDCVKRRSVLKSPLSNEENERLSQLLFSLGKSDSDSQKKLISGFCEYIKVCAEKYRASHSKNSRLYVSFGFFFGALVSLLII